MHRSTSIIYVFAGIMFAFAAGCESSDPVLGGPGPFADQYDEFTTTDSGLKYRITREGDGEKPESADAVMVHYRGQLADGTEFESSYKNREPIRFPLAAVIPGWTEGLQFVKVGGMIELIIPPDLGYGDSGRPGGGDPTKSDALFYGRASRNSQTERTG